MKMANYSNQSAVMLSLLSLLLIPVFAVERQIDTTQGSKKEPTDYSTLLKQLKKLSYVQLSKEVSNIITTEIKENNEKNIKNILELLSDESLSERKFKRLPCKDFAFMVAFHKENTEMLKNIINLQNPPKPVGFDTLSNCLKLAIKFQKKHLLNFLSDKHNLNIDQDGVDALFLAILDSVDCKENVFRGSWEGSWGGLSEELSDVDSVEYLNVVCNWKEVVDVIFDNPSIKPSEECIKKCFKNAIHKFNEFDGDFFRRTRWDLNNIHNSVKVLLYKCKEKGVNVDESKILDAYVRNLKNFHSDSHGYKWAVKAIAEIPFSKEVCKKSDSLPEYFDAILDAYVRNLKNIYSDTREHDTAMRMMTEMPFSKAVYEKNSRLSAYLDDNKLSDKEFYKIMQIRTKDGGNAPFAEYLIERYLQGKHDVSPQAMDNVMKNSTVDTGGKIGIGGLKRLSKKPHLPVSGWPQSKDVMQHISEYNGNSRIEPDLLNRVKTYRESQRVKGIVHQPVAPKEMANQVEENKE